MVVRCIIRSMKVMHKKKRQIATVSKCVDCNVTIVAVGSRKPLKRCDACWKAYHRQKYQENNPREILQCERCNVPLVEDLKRRTGRRKRFCEPCAVEHNREYMREAQRRCRAKRKQSTEKSLDNVA